MTRLWVLSGVAGVFLLTACGDDDAGDGGGGAQGGSGGTASGAAGLGGSAGKAGSSSSGGSGAGAGGNATGGSSAGAGTGGATGGSSGSATGGSSGTGGGGLTGPGPSCNGLDPICGPMGDQPCCASSVVPGGTFNRNSDARFPATVSSFGLDRYEVTVGRLRRFVDAYPGSLPAAGSGKNPNNPADTGWNATWDMPATRDELVAGLTCSGQTWTDTPEIEDLPANCLNWYVAYAFCIWDNGHLPTEAEFGYARAGGSEQRPYPWSASPTDETIDDTYAVFGDTAPDGAGSRSPKGDGRWGHADLAGNMTEYNLDTLAALPVPCSDCSNATGSERITQGGHFRDNAPVLLLSEARDSILPGGGALTVGVRCARSP